MSKQIFDLNTFRQSMLDAPRFVTEETLRGIASETKVDAAQDFAEEFGICEQEEVNKLLTWIAPLELSCAPFEEWVSMAPFKRVVATSVETLLK